MHIAFDAAPVISERMTGIGYCQSGQVKALSKIYKKDTFELQYFSVRTPETKEKMLLQYKTCNTSSHSTFFSGLLYRIIQNFIPLPYSWFFGKKADVTHFFNYIVPPGVGTAVVVTVHDMVYKSHPETMNSRTRKLLDMSLKRSMKRATLIVTDSEFSKTEIVKYFPQFESKVRVVPCGVDTKKFMPVKNKADIAKVKINFNIHGDYFLYLGTLEPRKNLVRLIDSYSKAKAKLEEKGAAIPHLVIAGGRGWLYEEIFETVEKLGLGNDVIFTKYIPDEDLCPLICGALAFVFPSIYEGFGLPPLEAMTCGVPVIVSDAASLPEVVGDSALIADAYNTDDMAEKLLRIYNEPQLRRELSEKGIKRAEKFTWENSAKKLYEVYKEADRIYRQKKKK